MLPLGRIDSSVNGLVSVDKQEESCVELRIPSHPGYEKVAMATAAAVALDMGFAQERIDALGTALAEACLNAIEHGNRWDARLAVVVKFSIAATCLQVEVVDKGEGLPATPQVPCLEDQVEGRAERRGWGLHLMENLVDEVRFRESPQGEHMTCLCLFKKKKSGVAKRKGN